MAYYGDLILGDTIDVKFSTISQGVPFTLAGSPVISAYLGNNTTELTAGITLSVDFDGRTGLNNIRVVASNGNGYAVSTNYTLVITTGTVNGVSAVGYVVGSFSIQNRLALLSTGTGTGQLDFTSGVVKSNSTQWLGGAIPAVNVTGVPKVDLIDWLGTAPLALSSQQVQAIVSAYASGQAPLQPATAGRTLVVDAAGLADANMVKVGPTGAGTAQTAGDIPARLPSALATDGSIKASLQSILGTAFTEGAAGRIAAAFKQFFNIAAPAATMDHGILVDTVTTYTGNTPQTGDVYGALTGAQSEPGQAAPAVNASPLTKLAWLFKAWRNRTTQTATQYSLYADNTTTLDNKASFSDDTVTADRSEIGAGP